MFRSKKKKVGGATRKRKDFDDDGDEEPAAVELTKPEPMDVDEGEREGEASNELEATENGDADDENAMLERMRSRMQKTKSSSASAMSFSSKAASAKKSRRVVLAGDEEEEREDGVASGASAPTGGLSFDDDEIKSSSNKNKLRIRPNLSASHAMKGAEEDGKSTNMYSEDMMAALLREQKVLMRRTVPTDAVEAAGDNIVMEGADAERMVHEAVDEEMKGEDEDASAEEFIPLNAKLLKTKKDKKRVTFGVHNDEFYPAKTAEVEEPVTASEGEEGDEEDADQSKRWEDELMRRGGGHHIQQPPFKAAYSRVYDAKTTYPTRKSVPCASLGEVMRSIQKKVNTGEFERDRVSRELARVDAETELIQKKLREQREELLVCSEQFEYFQVVEDFVKGLSFCLREKLPEIEREERKRASAWLASAKANHTQRLSDVNDEIRLCIEGNTLQRRHFTNFPSTLFEANGNGANLLTLKATEGGRFSRFHQGYQSSPPAQVTSVEWDVFADAVDDFTSLTNVYGRFQEWKVKFPDVYKNAYCDLALSKLYAPYIRAEIIDWDPLRIAGGMAKASHPRPQRVSEMAWFKTLRLHQGSQNTDLEEPLPCILREVIVARVVEATKSQFDAFSSTHVQSIIDFIEDLALLNATKYVEHGLEEIVTNVSKKLSDEAKHFPLLAVNEVEASTGRVREFATFLVTEFCTLLENALTLFVSLPSGLMRQQGFNTIMLVLHQLLAYVNHSQQEHKTVMLPHVTRTIQQLSASSFMQSILARSTREQFEFQRVLHLLRSSVNAESAT